METNDAIPVPHLEERKEASRKRFASCVVFFIFHIISALHPFRSLSEADCLQDVGSPTNRPKLNVAKHATHHAHLQSSGKNNDRCEHNENTDVLSGNRHFTN